MLEALRNSVNTWFAKVLLALLVVSFAAWGIADVFTGRTLSTVAKVGETEVDARDYARALTDRLQGIQQQTGRAVTLSEARQLGIDQVVLAQITTREALNEEARKLGLSADGQAVRRAIEEAPSFQNALGNFDRDTYERRVSYRGQTIAEFEADVREDLAREIMLQSIGAGTTAPRSLAEALYRHRNEERVFEFVTLSADDAPEPGTPSDEQIAAFHEENAERFTAPEYREISFAWLTAEAFAEKIEIEQDAVVESYGARIAEFTSPATRTLDQLLFDTEAGAEAAKAEIDAGATFASIVEAQGANPQDVSLGRVIREELTDELAGPAFDATGPVVLGPIRTAFGWTLLNIRGVEEKRVAPLEEVQDRVRDDLALLEARAQIIEESVALDDELAGGATVEQAANLTAALFGSAEAVDANGRDTDGNRVDGLPPIPELLEQAFTAEPGTDPTLVEVDSGGFFAVSVKDVTPATLRPLETVRDEVVEAWKTQKRLDGLSDIGEEITAALKDGATLDEIANERSLNLGDTGPIRRNTPVRGLTDTLIADIFASDEGTVLSAPGAGDTHVVGRLKEIVAVEPDALQASIDAESERYAGRLANDIVQTFTRAAQERNETLLYPGVIESTLQELGQR